MNTTTHAGKRKAKHEGVVSQCKHGPNLKSITPPLQEEGRRVRWSMQKKVCGERKQTCKHLRKAAGINRDIPKILSLY